ncbi:nucleoside recognition domain-containing protein [Pleionea sp. CnH1-48]|uniref:nucleoside recognition domain-containing protein n=1 Tax=Pleionea sp. CnH1-48 TaxID=2954494 RepID=UPI002097DA42|nr:nucleoside recognition domain-containing protein [Pleionea sp. CnH1-48]MCO7224833.1 hypothetical protein [Pleionea sp. CnH1-48]
MNLLWAGFILISFVAAIFSWLVNGDIAIFSRMLESVFQMSKLSIEIALGLVGLLCFWMGILKIAEVSGVLSSIARLLEPLLRRLMPEVPAGHPAFGHITMNIAANIFSLDNAATPAGIKAMESLQTLNKTPDTATNAQILFLVLNTSAVTLFPVTILMYRAQLGAVNPADVFLPLLLATSASTFIGLSVVMLIQRIRFVDSVLLGYFLAAATIVGSLIYWLHSMPVEQMTVVSGAIGNGLLLFIICYFIAMALWRRVAVYDVFIDGAKEGFHLAVKIMPYLVAMLVAIGLLRSSGVLNVVSEGVRKLVLTLGGDARFVDALPTAFMRPFSGSGARAMMLESMNTHGVDSFVGRLVATIQGSTETTFYVLTVYFGAVGIKKIRHSLGCGLVADAAGVIAAIVVSYWFFGS